MKRIPKPGGYVAPEAPQPAQASEVFDVEKLLERGGEILRREISNLLMESSSKKLSPASARDLVAYVRLLSELKAQQLDVIDNMTDEELEKIANES